MPSPTTATAPSAPRDLSTVRRLVATREGLLDLQAEIICKLLYGDPSDNEVRALQAAQRGGTICREIIGEIEQAAIDEALERGLNNLEQHLGGQVGGVVTTDEAPPFNPSGGATH